MKPIRITLPLAAPLLVTLAPGKPESLFKKGGIDDLKSDPAGNSGSRAFCGVIAK